MNQHWIIYRDIADAPRRQFERLPTPDSGDLVIKDGKIPGLFGHKDMYIKRHAIQHRGEVINLVTYTEAPVSAAEAAGLVEEALRQEKAG